MLVELYVLVEIVNNFGWCFWVWEVCGVYNIDNWYRNNGMVLLDFF